MLSTVRSQPGITCAFKLSAAAGTLTSPANRNPSQISVFINPNPKRSPGLFFHSKLTHNTTRCFTFPAVASSSSALSAVETPTDDDDDYASDSEKLGVLVKLIGKPRLVLKFIWMEKIIGLALDQVIPGHGSIPLTPYYFWPTKDAWEELKNVLERKPWISQKQVVILLNQATDIINLWQQSTGGDLS